MRNYHYKATAVLMFLLITAFAQAQFVADNRNMDWRGKQIMRNNLIVGDSGCAASAVAEFKSTSKGMLMPRVSASQMAAIASPATGLLIYNTSVNAFHFWNGSAWVMVGGGSITGEPNGIVYLNEAGEAVTDTTHLSFDTVGGLLRFKVFGGIAQTTLPNFNNFNGHAFSIAEIGYTPIHGGGLIPGDVMGVIDGDLIAHFLTVDSFNVSLTTSSIHDAYSPTFKIGILAKEKIDISIDECGQQAIKHGIEIDSSLLYFYRKDSTGQVISDMKIVEGVAIRTGTDFVVKNLSDQAILKVDATTGYVGIGTDTPQGFLDVVTGSKRLLLNETNNLYLLSGDNGLDADSWDFLNHRRVTTVGGVPLFTIDKDKCYFQGVPLGINTTTPAADLEVDGTFKYVTGNEGIGKILTSNGNGTADWQSSSVHVNVSALGQIGYGSGATNTLTGSSDFTYYPGNGLQVDGFNFSSGGEKQVVASDGTGGLYWKEPELSGHYSGVGTATTTFTVTFGGTQPNNNYKVGITPRNPTAAALYYVTNQTTTTFDVMYLAGLTGTVTFDWVLNQ